MENKFWYRIFVFSIFVVLLGIGGIIGYKIITNNSNIIDYTLDNINDADNKDAINIYNYDEVESVSTKTHDIEVVYIDSYTLCNENITTSDIFYGVNLEELKKQEKEKQEREKNIYEIVEENSERIVFKKVYNTYCPNHFKVLLEDKKINVYNKITDEKYEIYKTLEIPVETLRIEVVNELTGGILVNSKEELNMIIEDIES